MSLESAFAPIEEAYVRHVQEATWGHLAPKKNKRCHGQLIFSRDAYHGGRICILKCEFEGLDSSPWSYDFFHDYAQEKSESGDDIIYIFTGYFCNYELHGKLQQIKI